MADRRIVIAGAGALGLSCAYHLLDRPGFDVTVVDREFPGSGSSGLSAGVYTRQYLDPDVLALRIRAVHQLEQLERDHGFHLQRIGFVRLARDAAAVEWNRQSVEAQHALGLTESRLVGPGEIASMMPDLDLTGVLGGVYCPTDGYMDGALLCTTLAEQLTARGGRLLVRAPVEGLSRGGSAKYAVRTPRGEIPADMVVNAAGAWGSVVGEALEAPVTVVNERHEAYTFRLPEGVSYTLPMTMDYAVGSGGKGLYFRHEGSGQLLAGLHSNEILGESVPDPDDYYRGVRQANVDDIVERMAAAFPALDGIGYEGGWAGLYPHSPSGDAVLGPHPDNPDIIVGAGLGGIGLSVSMALGEVLADWIAEGRPVAVPGAERLRPTAETLHGTS